MVKPVIPKRWIPKPAPDPGIVKALADSLNVKESLSTLIAQRSITNFEEAEAFFNPSLESTWDPFRMKGMEKAVKRIRAALQHEESVLVFGDYDVDGTTAVSMVYKYLKEMTGSIYCYVPDRFREGYGISPQGIDYGLEKGCTLMIVLDCGIKAVEQVAYANEKGLDTIICDHHTPGVDIPSAHAILNPKQEGCPYPYKELSGCGIGFKLLQAIEATITKAPEARNFIDFVAVSTASDIVQITGENRTLTYHGLKRLNENPNPAFSALIEMSGLKEEITVTDLVFRIGPRINAAGRVDHANNAVELLTTRNKDEALRKAQWVNKHNTQRQQFDQTIKAEALDLIDNDEILKNKTTTVLYNPEWHKGVIGIVASRLIEQYFRPTILLTRSNNLAVGSGRSVPGFSIYNALNSCADLLEQFGGHEGAAGLALKIENLTAFTERFESVVKDTIDPELLIPTLDYDLEIPFSTITPSFVKTIKRFAPFGPGNLNPVFVSRGIKAHTNPKVVGDDHLKLLVKQENGPGIDAIAFNQASMHEAVMNGKLFDVCYTLEENTWNGKTRIQLNVKDIKVHKEA